MYRGGIGRPATSRVGNLSRDDSRSSSSLPGATGGLLVEVDRDLFELSEKRSGSHRATKLANGQPAASNVNRLGTPRAASISQTSIFPCTLRSTATRRPSGESSGILEIIIVGPPQCPHFLAGPIEPSQTPKTGTATLPVGQHSRFGNREPAVAAGGV